MASIIATNVLNPINASHCWANNGSLQPIVNGLRIIQLESNEKINNCKDPLFISKTQLTRWLGYVWLLDQPPNQLQGYTR